MEKDNELVRVVEYFKEALDELKYKNRFSNEKLDDIVTALTSESSNTQEFNRIRLYRARKYTEPDAVARYKNPSDPPFQGYDEKNSFVNPKGIEGRCNPQFIAYLYAANTVDCCIAEIHPGIDQVISVAEIVAIQPLKILRLSKTFAISSGKSIIQNVPDSTTILYLQNLFSKPHSEDGDYLLTQYLSEKIKGQGFDGISFFSSVYKDQAKNNRNINFTIFNYNKCKAVSSELYKVDAIKLSISRSTEKV